MRSELLALLSCPECRGKVALQDTWRAEGDEILEAGLACACGQKYPVIDGVPRMLPATLASMVAERHPDFFRRHPTYANDASVRPTVARRTAESFGYLWKSHPEMLSRFHEHWEAINARFAADFFRGKWVLEAGCGNGRYAVEYAAAGAKVVAVDLSEAIDVAAQNGAGRTELHFVQADLTMPPFADDTFDFVNCFGVLQHLAKPREGFASQLRLAKPGGFLQGYVYKSFRDENRTKYAVLRGLAAVRLLTTRLPRNLLSAALWPAVPPYLMLVGGPHTLLRRLGASRLARSWPFFQQIPVLEPAHVHELLLDRFSTPIEHRFTRAEFLRWFVDAGLEEVQVHEMGGWIASGRKPARAVAEPRPPVPTTGTEPRRRLAVLS
jgi:SAM-dependent methyltransferase/uncharacterized protein YbaR (Trm112 family)